jgi:hypothetical protein
MCIDDDWSEDQRALFNHVMAFLAGMAAAGGDGCDGPPRRRTKMSPVTMSGRAQ